MKRVPLRARSAKKIAADRRWQKLRQEVFARDDHTCQAIGLLDGHHCGGTLEAHHVRRRSQGGRDELWNLVTLCSRAHLWVHTHPAEARLFGLLEFTGDDQ